MDGKKEEFVGGRGGGLGRRGGLSSLGCGVGSGLMPF